MDFELSDVGFVLS